MRLFLFLSLGLFLFIIVFVVYCALRVGSEADRAMAEYFAMQERQKTKEDEYF